MGQSYRQRGGYALPFSYPPTLAWWEALLRVFGALARILLGSILFAVCGAYAWHDWETIHNPWVRWAALTGIFLIFAACFATVLYVIHVVIEAAARWGKKSSAS